MSLLKSYWVQIPWWSVRKASRILWLASLGSLLIGVIVFSLYMNSLPSLSTWHTTILKNEFNTNSNVKNFDAYIALEENLFDELDTQIYDKVLEDEKNKINRYTRNSFADPKRWKKFWNKTFELPVKNPKMGVLLLHGMSDSPYSLHAQAEYLHKQGVWVVGMRMPGHGTIPSGLIELQWQDMAAVVKIGMKRLEDKVGTKPVHIIGYSTGAPLALNYTLSSFDDPSLFTPSSLIFYSPAIGVSKAAPFAIWQSRLGHLLGSQKLSWNDIGAEFDPFKYASFAVNAGDQVYRVCSEVQEQFDTYAQKKDKKPFPPVLSFSSIVDSTVSVNDTVHSLYKRLPKGDHTLVLFDINHNFSTNHFIRKGVNTSLEQLRQTSIGDNYTFDLISNINDPEGKLVQIRNGKIKKSLSVKWDKGLYSLSHLAMPISRNDPTYGDQNAPKSPGVQLGHLAVYGETSVLQTSPASLLRQRWNPFHEYTKERVLKFMQIK
ncbi:alpha/beta fold hydrolase [Sulfurovum sp.]|uniref:alpha/beta hydrolase n=1 Tax=Sulfurovum sp. TaxID=1969726 RepID=UPI002867D70D|nr:alpha/beta fold hydrolase [Sulfurovum sp.]